MSEWKLVPILSDDERATLRKEHSDASFSTTGYFDGEKMQWTSFDRDGLRSFFDAIESAVLAKLAARGGELPELPPATSFLRGDVWEAEQVQQYARDHAAGVVARILLVCDALYKAPLAPSDSKYVEGWQDALDIAEQRIGETRP